MLPHHTPFSNQIDSRRLEFTSEIKQKNGNLESGINKNREKAKLLAEPIAIVRANRQRALFNVDSEISKIPYDTIYVHALRGAYHNGTVDLRTIPRNLHKKLTPALVSAWEELASAEGKILEIMNTEEFFSLRHSDGNQTDLATTIGPRVIQHTPREISRLTRIFSFLQSEVGASETEVLGQVTLSQTINGHSIQFPEEGWCNASEAAKKIASNASIQSDLLALVRSNLSKSKFGEFLIETGLLKNTDWEVVAQMDYTSSRDANKYLLHKDGPLDGRMLFATLNYANSMNMLTPEFIADQHKYNQELALPENIKGMINSRKNEIASDPPMKINCQTIPPYGAFSWCDPLIMHSTPLLASRKISSDDAKSAVIEYLESLFGQAASGMYRLAEEIDLSQNGEELNPTYRMLALIAHILRSPTVYHDDLVAAGIPAYVLNTAHKHPRALEYATRYAVAHCTDNCLEDSDFQFHPLTQTRAGRLERELSEKLSEVAATNYPDVRPSFIRVAILVTPKTTSTNVL
jgi:hypothetical protein